MTGRKAYQLGLGGEVRLLRLVRGGYSMSRIGKVPITVPAGVKVEIAADNVITVTGPKGQRSTAPSRRASRSSRTATAR